MVNHPNRSKRMTLAKARMIVRNPRSGYSVDEVREAAVYILGSLEATSEDIDDASHAAALAG